MGQISRIMSVALAIFKELIWNKNVDHRNAQRVHIEKKKQFVYWEYHNHMELR